MDPAGAGREPLRSLDDVDCALLTRIVRRAGYPGAEVTGFRYESTAGKSHGGGSVYRFHLTLRPMTSGRHPETTSVILKDVRPPLAQALDPGLVAREAACYAHDLFAGLGERLRVPAAYLVVEPVDARPAWLWLEDLGDAFAVDWSIDLLAGCVRDLAELHATWWGRTKELRRMAFLKPRAHAMYDGLWAERIAANCAAVAAHPQASQLSTVFTAARRDLLVRLARAADRVYPLLDRLPQTLLHHDVWLPNLGISGDRTVLVDWAFAGVGPPGSELSQTVALLCQMWGPDVDDDHLIEALFRGLVEDHGLPISFEEVRAGYELSFCLRPAHALGGPVLGGILSGRATMVGATDLESRLASAEAVFRRIERGIRRVDA